MSVGVPTFQRRCGVNYLKEHTQLSDCVNCNVLWLIGWWAFFNGVVGAACWRLSASRASFSVPLSLPVTRPRLQQRLRWRLSQTRQRVSGLKVLCDAGRAKVIVREDTTKNRAWGLGQAAREVWSRHGCDESYRSVSIKLAEREKPFEDVWRDWVKKVSKLPQAQAIQQQTISGLSTTWSARSLKTT